MYSYLYITKNIIVSNFIFNVCNRSFFDNVASWWKYKHCNNILFLHFNDLKKDLPGSVRRIAAFLEIPIIEKTFDLLVQKLNFEYMQSHCSHEPGEPLKDAFVPLNGAMFSGGATSFIYKGTNGRWKGVLSEEQLHKYNEVMNNKLPSDCIEWLVNGTIHDN